MAEPGMVAKGLAALLQKNSPLAIRFRLDPALWSWLAHFALRCNARDMVEAGRGIQPLLESSLELYQELIDREHLECEWEKKGLLFPYRSKEALDAYTPTDRLLAETFQCRPGVSTANRCGSWSRPSGRDWPAAGTTTTMLTCGRTDCSRRGGVFWRIAASGSWKTPASRRFAARAAEP